MTRRLWALCATIALGIGAAQVAHGQLITKPERINSDNGALLDAWMITRQLQ